MKEFETNEEFIYALIIEDLDDSISTANRSILEEWRASDPSNEKTYRDFVHVQRNIDDLYAKQLHTPEESWAVLDRKIALQDKESMPVVKKMSPALYCSIAASILLICSIGYYFMFSNPYTVISNDYNASTKNITLPDGTKIAMRRGTTIKYTERQFDTNRTVYLLAGEVFVDVVHDDSHPFVVNMGDVKAMDIGTSFNIRKEEDEITLTVKEGKVHLQDPKTRQSAMLAGGITGRYSYVTGKISTEKNKDVNYKSWLDKDFVFVETPITEVASELGIAYNTSIVVKGKLLSKRKLTAHLHYQTADSALNVIAATLQCKVIPAKDHYILSEN